MKGVGIIFLLLVLFARTSAGIGISLPTVTGRVGDTLDIPILTTTVPDSSVISWQFTIAFSPSTIAVLSMSTQGTLTSQSGWAATEYIKGDSITAGAYGSTFFAGAGTIVKIRCIIKGPVGSSSPLVLRRFMYNAGSPEVATTNGSITVITSIDDGSPLHPATTALFQNYPNPFNPSTTIPYVLERSGHVQITIYSSLGQVIRTLVNQDQDRGAYRISLDGRDLSSGVYFVRMRSGSTHAIRSMLLMK